MYGESVSLRLLSQNQTAFHDRVGLAQDEEQKLTRALASPHGIIRHRTYRPVNPPPLPPIFGHKQARATYHYR